MLSDEKLVRFGEAAKLAGQPRSSFARAVQRGHVPFATVAGVRVSHVADLNEYAEWRKEVSGRDIRSAA